MTKRKGGSRLPLASPAVTFKHVLLSSRFRGSLASIDPFPLSAVSLPEGASKAKPARAPGHAIPPGTILDDHDLVVNYSYRVAGPGPSPP